MTRKDEHIVVVVRHGRTALNAESRLRGSRSTVPLDHVGVAQARALAALLGEHGITAVYTSPAVRARQTAGPIAAACDAMPTVIDALADRDYGPWTGVSEQGVTSRFGDVDRAPGVESRDTVRERIRAAFDGITAGMNAASRIVIVGHDATNRALIESLAGVTKNLPQPTGCWNRLRHDGRCWYPDIIGAVPEETDHAHGH